LAHVSFISDCPSVLVDSMVIIIHVLAWVAVGYLVIQLFCFGNVRLSLFYCCVLKLCRSFSWLKPYCFEQGLKSLQIVGSKIENVLQICRMED
jgi:hypothetical protein